MSISSNTTLTELEVIAVKAIAEDQYQDGSFDAETNDPGVQVWTWSVSDTWRGETGKPATSFPGVISSLVKKGVVGSYDGGGIENDACLWIKDDAMGLIRSYLD